jgi:uncharacterized protein
MSTEDITFSNRGVHLAGTLFWPESKLPCPALVVLHAANGGTRQFPFYQHLINLLPALGVALLLYDRRGTGESGGHEPALFTTLAEDGAAAVDALSSKAGIDPRRICLYGVSQGGWLAPETAVLRPEVAGLVIVSGCGISPAQQMDYAAAYNLRQADFSDEDINQALALRRRLHACYRGLIPRQQMAIELDLAQSEPWFAPAYLDGSDNLPPQPAGDPWAKTLDYDPLPAWHKFRQPALFLFADQDRWVPVAESMTRFREATAHLPDVTLAQISGTDHLMSEVAGSEAGSVSPRYLEMLKGWLSQRLHLRG